MADLKWTPPPTASAGDILRAAARVLDVAETERMERTTLGGGKLEPVHPNHRPDLRYILDTLQMVRPVLKNEPLRQQVEASITGMVYIIKRTEEAAASGVGLADSKTQAPSHADGPSAPKTGES
jgi:hypothetical protein